MHLYFSPAAVSDLEIIGRYIARDNPSKAVRFIGKLRRQCAEIACSPLAYRVRPEIEAGILSCALGRYVIFLKDDDSSVTVVRILHGAMDAAARFAISSKADT